MKPPSRAVHVIGADLCGGRTASGQAQLNKIPYYVVAEAYLPKACLMQSWRKKPWAEPTA